jgi:hypothetical protein
MPVPAGTAHSRGFLRGPARPGPVGRPRGPMTRGRAPRAGRSGATAAGLRPPGPGPGTARGGPGPRAGSARRGRGLGGPVGQGRTRDRPTVGGHLADGDPHALRLAAGRVHIRLGELANELALLLGGLARGLHDLDERHGVPSFAVCARGGPKRAGAAVERLHVPGAFVPRRPAIGTDPTSPAADSRIKKRFALAPIDTIDRQPRRSPSPTRPPGHPPLASGRPLTRAQPDPDAGGHARARARTCAGAGSPFTYTQGGPAGGRERTCACAGPGRRTGSTPPPTVPRPGVRGQPGTDDRASWADWQAASSRRNRSGRRSARTASRTGTARPLPEKPRTAIRRLTAMSALEA